MHGASANCFVIGVFVVILLITVGIPYLERHLPEHLKEGYQPPEVATTSETTAKPILRLTYTQPLLLEFLSRERLPQEHVVLDFVRTSPSEAFTLAEDKKQAA